MHESFRLEEIVPQPPGTSPFHVRGIYYIRVLDHARRVPGGLSRLLDELADPRVRDFMQQRFQFMTWYDVFPTLPCGIAMARICNRPFEAFMRETGHLAMTALAPSMFRLFSRFAGPRFAASHAPRLMRAYFDFVHLHVHGVNEREGTGSLSGIPLYVAPSIVNQLLGITSGALESLGATAVEGSYDQVVKSGSLQGQDLVTCRAHLKWSLAQQVDVG